jgi:hypothetical protein
MRPLSRAAVLTSLVFLSACLESAVPLAPSEKATLDPALLGQWEPEGDESEEANALEVLQFDDRQYFVRLTKPRKKDEEPLNCRAFITKVGGVSIINLLNISSPEGKERTYLYFKYSLGADGILTVTALEDDIRPTPPPTSRALYAYVEKNLKNEKLYGRISRFRRAAAAKAP